MMNFIFFTPDRKNRIKTITFISDFGKSVLSLLGEKNSGCNFKCSFKLLPEHSKWQFSRKSHGIILIALQLICV